MRKALVIEDNASEAADYMAVLKSMGYKCDIAHAGDIGYSMLGSGDYDVAVIDQVLPGMDGETIVRNARRNGIKTIIICASNHVGKAERLEVVLAGADHYIEKPVSADELMSYVAALERRVGGEQSVIAYRSIVVNKAERTAFCNDKDLELKGQIFDFLVLLLDNRGRYVPAKRILKEICPGAKTLGLDAVRQVKLRLCERLEACGAGNVIETKKGVGYAIL